MCETVEYISKDKFKKWVLGQNRLSKHYVLSVLDEMEAEDVRPERYGEWLPDEYDGYADGKPVWDTWICSACGLEVETDGEPPTDNYCPDCGAKMDEVKT